MKQLRIRAAMTVALALVCGCTVDDKGPRPSTGGGGGQGGTGLASSTHSSSGTMEGVGGAGGNAGAGGSVGGAGGSGGDGGSMAGCSSNLDCEVLLSNIVPQGCVNALCDTATGACSFSTIDADGDGHGTALCMADGATIVPGDDCDDTDPLKFPGAWDGPEDPMAGVADQCNGVDNDCDGTADDDNVGSASCICDPATNVNVPCHERADGTPIMFPGGTPQGSCLAGVKNCVAGAWESCIGALEPLTADTCAGGNDDNCNGIPNEGCACIAGATSTCAALFGSGGVCGSTTVTCDASGHWPQVCPTVPSPELCNGDGLDEDCDGFVNDGCACVPGTTATCAAAFGSKGVCANGLVTCGADGKWPMQCPAAASLELCNGDGLDEDCDGFVNDGCECLTGQTMACGACGSGMKYCDNGAWSDCTNSTAGLVVVYRDADGDGYCNKANVAVVCGVPAGYMSTGCSADCNDNNGYAHDACVTLFNKSAEPWQKPWANPACGGHTWPVCPVGFHTSSCYAFRVNGGGHINPPSWSGTTCTLNICDDGFETATVYPGGTCEANP